MKISAVALVLIVSLGGSSCRSTNASDSPYLAPGDEDVARRTTDAERLSREAADLTDAGKLTEAETLLREALAADLFYGPAHNNLGVVFLKQEQLYEAASEFEWAKKLMPDSANPRINLALTLERAGSVSDAMKEYDSALVQQPGSLAAMKGAASLILRTGGNDERLDLWLTAIARRDPNSAWKAWAGLQLAKFDEEAYE